MDQQSKKRSIFAFTNLFRSSATPEDNRDDKMDPDEARFRDPARISEDYRSAAGPIKQAISEYLGIGHRTPAV
ncbi:hypothetical protein VTH82DRAFT_1897 [Thermothelomyces myriococcoides]